MEEEDHPNCSDPAARHWEVPYDKAISATFMCSETFVSNMVLLILLVRSIHSSNNTPVPRRLMLALCLTDLGYSVLSCSVHVTGYWIGFCKSGGMVTCIYKGYITNLLLTSSQLVVVSMAMERYTAMCHPFWYDSHVTHRRVAALITGIFLYAGAVASLPLLGVNHYGFQIFCGFHWGDKTALGRGYVYFIVIQGFGLMFVMAAANTVVIIEICKMKKYSTSANRKYSLGKLSTVSPIPSKLQSISIQQSDGQECPDPQTPKQSTSKSSQSGMEETQLSLTALEPPTTEHVKLSSDLTQELKPPRHTGSGPVVSDNNRTRTDADRQREFLAHMVVVSLAFFICMTPYLVRVLCKQVDVWLDPEFDFVAMRMYAANSMINAHIYWIAKILAHKSLWYQLRQLTCLPCNRRQIAPYNVSIVAEGSTPTEIANH